ncbi:hypothetical protein RI092_13205 [Lactococcus cremoris]|uniref:hypothetical protein n=1 Tax=Lactococcus lactis subsp. cremoris TaxID=1359 RepID=UPI0028711421|nr:hypothetical protein [Lactococcus cremoris]MDR9868713.1 hypothetical protein [Lactococcus cremoris]
MNKTILELSRELNITKKKLQNKIYNENKKMVDKMGKFEIVDGKETLFFNEKEQNLIKSWYATNDDRLIKSDVLKTVSNDVIIDYLNKIMKQNEEMKNEMIKLSDKIVELEGHQQKMLIFEDEKIKKKSFWTWIFGGNKK